MPVNGPRGLYVGAKSREPQTTKTSLSYITRSLVWAAETLSSFFIYFFVIKRQKRAE